MVCVGCRAVADQLGKWCGAARKRMIESFDYKHGGTLAHNKAIAINVKWARGALRRFIVMGGKRTCRCKAGKTDTFDAALRATANCDIDLAGADHARTVTDRLQAGGARADRWCALPVSSWRSRRCRSR